MVVEENLNCNKETLDKFLEYDSPKLVRSLHAHGKLCGFLGEIQKEVKSRLNALDLIDESKKIHLYYLENDQPAYRFLGKVNSSLFEVYTGIQTIREYVEKLPEDKAA